jgi:hypothetical protein
VGSLEEGSACVIPVAAQRGGHECAVVKVCIQLERRRLITADVMGKIVVWAIKGA